MFYGNQGSHIFFLYLQGSVWKLNLKGELILRQQENYVAGLFFRKRIKSISNEPPHGKTYGLLRRTQRHRSASQ